MENWVGREITLVLGDKKVKGKVVSVSRRTGKLKIETGPYDNWDVHPSMVSPDNTVVVKEYTNNQILNEYERHIEKKVVE